MSKIIPYTQRRDGSEAEGKFESWAKKNNADYVVYGFRGTDVPKFYLVPPFIRHTPDFLMFWKGHHALVETKGTGRDGVIKIKLVDIEEFRNWRKIMPLWIFIWNSHLQKIAMLTFEQVEELANESPIWTFPEGNKYYGISGRKIEWQDWA